VACVVNSQTVAARAQHMVVSFAVRTVAGNDVNILVDARTGRGARCFVALTAEANGAAIQAGALRALQVRHSSARHTAVGNGVNLQTVATRVHRAQVPSAEPTMWPLQIATRVAPPPASNCQNVVASQLVDRSQMPRASC
jgi:hypothetical protein